MALRSAVLAAGFCLAAAAPAYAASPDLTGRYLLTVTKEVPKKLGGEGSTDCLVLTQNGSVLKQPVSGVADLGGGTTLPFVKVNTQVLIPAQGTTYLLSLKGALLAPEGEGLVLDSSGNVEAIAVFTVAKGGC